MKVFIIMRERKEGEREGGRESSLTITCTCLAVTSSHACSMYISFDQRVKCVHLDWELTSYTTNVRSPETVQQAQCYAKVACFILDCPGLYIVSLCVPNRIFPIPMLWTHTQFNATLLIDWKWKEDKKKSQWI